jgi:hypothetical protein
MAGVRLCLNRKERKSKNANDFIANINPILAVTSPSSSDDIEEKRDILPKKRDEEKKSSSLHHHLVQTIVKPNFKEKEDPRIELLKHAEEAKRNPKWVTPAYVHTQPKPIFQQQLEEEDKEEEAFLPIFKKSRKT